MPEYTDQPCCFCGSTVLAGRIALGKGYCMAPACVAQGDTFKRDFRLMLVPKQGFTWVRVTDPALTTVGRSSGRAV